MEKQEFIEKNETIYPLQKTEPAFNLGCITADNVI